MAWVKRTLDALDRWMAAGDRAQAPPLDASVEVITPENIAFLYRVAGPFWRVLAFGLDFLFCGLLFLGLTILWALFYSFIVLPAATAMGAPRIAYSVQAVFDVTMTILMFLVWWFYGAFLESWMNGQTFGKRLLSLRVLTTQGRPINALQATVRTFIKAAEALPIVSIQALGPLLQELFDASIEQPVPLYPTFLVGLIVMSLTSRFQRLGDLVCGTMVVYEERHWFHGLAKVDDVRTPKLAEYIPPDFVISPSMARALAAYVDRRRYFSAGRRREIAKHLAEPLLPQFGLPADTSYDLLLCAMYYRAFIADQGKEQARQSEILEPATAATPGFTPTPLGGPSAESGLRPENPTPS